MNYAALGLIAFIFFISCENGNTTDNSARKRAPITISSEANYTPPAGVDSSVSASLKPVMNSYLHLKNTLVDDNSTDASLAAHQFLATLSSVDTAAMTPAQKNSFNHIVPDMRIQAQHISENKKINDQRSYFKALSEDVHKLARVFGGGRKLFVAHCSMAMDGKGASWISEFPEIRNPYFGDQMLECGEVKEELK
ncbi:MAG TPA: DUF3347 domain-containing protein [Flavipsychrobacter sp.]|nr:DUF3347 domain-containing protein [Flavipsychrobacter sp.]